MALSKVRKLNGAGSKHTARWEHREEVKTAGKRRRREEDKALAVEEPSKARRAPKGSQ